MCVKAGATAEDSCHTDTLFLLATERSMFQFSGFKVVYYKVFCIQCMDGMFINLHVVVFKKIK